MNSWGPATFPHEPRDEPTVAEISGALLTKVERGPLRIYGRPSRYFKGAVYDSDHKLVVESQKAVVSQYPWAAADPMNLSGGTRVREKLSGRWLYGGHWMQHFGHFMIETLPALWPEVSGVDGLVFHTYHRGRSSVEPWQQRSLDLIGKSGLPIHVVGKASGLLEVENLVVAGRPVVMQGWAHPQALDVWRRISDQFADTTAPEKVFLSRTQFNARLAADDDTSSRKPRTSPRRDRELDRVFEEHGFEVIAPETLTIDDQFRIFSNAKVLAGCSGSALHMSAFAATGSKVIEIGDSNSPKRPQGTQLVIDTLCGHLRRYVPAATSAEEISAVLAEL